MGSVLTPAIRKAILAGRIQDDMNFNERVWALCRRIPRGRVATYGDLAAAMDSRACRAVGQALHRNPLAPKVPCHRVVGSDGKLTGYAEGLAAKARMLHDEGVCVAEGRVNLKEYRWQPVQS